METKILKRSVPLWAFLLCVLLSASAIALIYMTAQMTMNANLIVLKGTIKLYSNAECTIEITSFNWGDFEVKSGEGSDGDVSKTLDVWIKNIGNTKAYVRYFLTGTGWTWSQENGLYSKGFFRMYLTYGTPPFETTWYPKESPVPSVLELNAGNSEYLLFNLVVKFGATEPQTESITVNFESSDS